MNHLSEEQLVEGYYDGLAPALQSHLAYCSECESLSRSIAEMLASANELTVPERGPGYGGEVWARVLPHLPLQKSKASAFRMWLLGTATAALLVFVFVAGMFTEHKRVPVPPAPDKTNQRVLYLSLSDYLDRAQITLTELAHVADPEEQRRARDLLVQNRILKQRTLQQGDTADAALLDDLERVLVQVAHSDAASDPDDLDALRRRINKGNLLFRVRIGSSDARLKGEKL